MLPRSLIWLDIHANRLESLDNYFGLDAGGGNSAAAVTMRLQHLNAGLNRIRALSPASLPNSIEILILNDNAIAEVAPYTFVEKTRLRRVDLTVNKMRRLERNALRIAPEAGQPPSFLLGGNLLECTCDMVWLQSVNSRQRSAAAADSSSLPRIADLESIYCQLPYTATAQAQAHQLLPAFAPLVDVRPADFLCPYRTHCFALCHCCDYDACDCEMACPAGCACYRDATWTNNIVTCHGNSSGGGDVVLRQLPPKIPMDATEIYLDGASLGRLKSHTFIGRKNLRVLHLNHSGLHVVDNHTFNGLPAMTVLHLEANRLTKLEGDEFQGIVP
jgi:Leucine-rich repeat (LRR) protein